MCGVVSHRSSHTSIAIGTDGFPIISYRDLSTTALRVYHCTATDCSSGAATTLDFANIVGLHSSTAIGTDNNAVVSYYDATGGNLSFARIRFSPTGIVYK